MCPVDYTGRVAGYSEEEMGVVWGGGWRSNSGGRLLSAYMMAMASFYIAVSVMDIGHING